MLRLIVAAVGWQRRPVSFLVDQLGGYFVVHSVSLTCSVGDLVVHPASLTCSAGTWLLTLAHRLARWGFDVRPHHIFARRGLIRHVS